ncbi:flagellar hook assembly protein FlgD [Lederbergia sp. NSJ-179]|uniref:flagellar hook assembly protein FlgD n=1 Tax=Lederbergia sp. NSJ-179 TaxID=2931402 RepID=UPI001FD368F9|nr:flagellar hook assembly protein FlgD [Lederbergia sp. NSJ-179]MCJ7839644.1 flagellar hook assembly protein FlgD [Lederbergia sp. NSJ-179]
MSTSIDPDLFYSSVQKREVKTGNDILGKDDFLKLLMTQLQNQDPMNPMEDNEFISQMATFSSLEQMTNMNNSIEKLVQLETQSSLIDFSRFVGKEVTWHNVVNDTETDEATVKEGKGVVTSVQFVGDSVKFILEDGTELFPANISQVNQTSHESPLVQASSLIGKKITWKEEDEQIQDIVQAVIQKDGGILFLTNNDQQIEPSRLIKVQ